MRLTVMVKAGEKELFLKTPLVITEPSEILLKVQSCIGTITTSIAIWKTSSPLMETV